MILNFGIELEAYNVKTTGKNGLYTGESAKFIENKNWHMATKHEESLVGRGGAELVSPILIDSPEDWKSISDICDHIKKFPGNKSGGVVSDEKCGLHVHFDADCLIKDPNRMKNFLKLYTESEELLYKMCNDKNDPIRPGAINRNLKGLNLISSIWRKGVAAPIGKKILKHIENNTLKVSFKKFSKLKILASRLKLDERRYAGLNLTNIGNPEKNTIEFRMANGTLNPKTIKQNVFLYSSLINTAIKITENPELYQGKLSEFYRTDVSEEKKAENFLNLIIENPEDIKIYMERWESVKNAAVFKNNSKKGFAQNRFKREEFKEIADKVPESNMRLAFNQIKKMLSKQNDKGALNYDR